MWHLVSSAMAVAVLLASNASCFADWENCTKGDIDHRIAACSQTIEEGPNGGTKRRDAYVIRGSLYLAKREFDLAIEDQSAAIRLDPNYAIAYDLRGGAFRQKGDFDRAIADFSEAI